MRKLTVKREKRFVACLMSMKLYIEDPISGDLTINGVQLRKLGELKNGEEKTFEIENHAAKLFVIADKVSKGYCSDVYELSEGEEDIYLTGRNIFNPATGNPFRFDNNTSELALQNRKSGSKKGIIIFAAAIAVGILVGVLIGFLGSAPDSEVFSASGMQITLNEDFIEIDQDGFTSCYGTPKVSVFTTKESFALAPVLKNYSVTEYAELSIEVYGLDSELKTDDGLTYFEYRATSPESNEEYYYRAYIYKADDAFWTIQFATSVDDLDEYSDDFSAWAKSVVFTK